MRYEFIIGPSVDSVQSIVNIEQFIELHSGECYFYLLMF